MDENHEAHNMLQIRDLHELVNECDPEWLIPTVNLYDTWEKLFHILAAK